MDVSGKKKRVLINVSGGIDSCALLKKYLLSTDYDIIVHKIYYDIRENGRQEKEIDSVLKILDKFKKIRSFEFVETFAGFYFMPPDTLDIPNLAFLTIPVAQSLKADEIVFGFISDKIGQEKRIAEMLSKFNGWYLDLCELNNWNILNKNLFKISEFQNTKKEYVKILGEDIKNVWYCRGTENYDFKEPCGKCSTCKHVQRVMIELKRESLILN